jgi:hypothetical protein
MKICRKCGQIKELSEFYTHPNMADGHLNICKDCKCAYAKKYGQSKRGKKTERKRNQKPKRKREIQKRADEWNKKYPKRYKAHNLVGNYVRDGKIKKPNSCQECGRTSCVIHGHHEDYDKPLDVEWLCPECHSKRHR